MKIFKPAKIKTIFTFVVVLLATFAFLPASDSNSFKLGPKTAEAGLQEDLDKVQEQLAALKKQKQDLQAKINNEKALQGEYSSEISRLSNEVQLLDIEISEKQLKIDELALTIEILHKTISETESDIIDSKITIDNLEEETDTRFAQMYVEQKIISTDLSIVFSSGSSENFLKNAQYKKSIQEETNKNLEVLKKTKKELEKKKAQLEEDKIRLEKDKSLIDEEKTSLEKDKTTYSQQKSYYSSLIAKSQNSVDASKQVLGELSEEEKQLLAQQEYLKQQIFNSIGSIPNGAKVLKGTIIGREGCTGVCTGPHLHFAVQVNGGWRNPCDVLPLKTLANTYCGVGNPSIPQWPMAGSPWLTSGYRSASRPTHNAIDIASGTGGAPIYAAHDGWIVYGNDGACSWYKGSYPCNGAGAKYAKICTDKNNCSNGISTMYFHLQ